MPTASGEVPTASRERTSWAPGARIPAQDCVLSGVGRPSRWTPRGGLVEVTCRTLQGRALLRPSPELNRRVLGVIGRAQRRECMKVHAVVVLSSHYHLLLSPDEPDQLVRFMQFVQTNIAKEAGELHDWSGSFWARRYRHVPVSDETEAQVARLRYVLENSVKENLVARPRDWPGVHSVQALLEGRPMEGVWYDRTALYEARCRGERVELEAFAEPETVTLSPLPCWQGLPLEEIRELLVGLIETIEQENDARRRAGGQGVLGVKAIRRRHPHERPKKLRDPRRLDSTRRRGKRGAACGTPTGSLQRPSGTPPSFSGSEPPTHGFRREAFHRACRTSRTRPLGKHRRGDGSPKCSPPSDGWAR